MKRTFELKERFNVSPERMYNAWLSSEEHSLMTGGDSSCSSIEGDEFMAWDGYITGRNIKLEKNCKIIQSWRTSEFDSADPDSQLTIEIQKTKEGCELTLIHDAIPEGQPDYEQGWIDNYFVPMKTYFGS